MGRTEQPEAHILLMLYGKDDAVLAALLAEQRATFGKSGIEEITVLDTHWLAKAPSISASATA